MQRSLVVSISFVAVCLLFFGGCGGGEDIPSNFKTTVEVTYKGEAVERAMVTLRPDGHDAPSANGMTGASGTVDLFSYKGKGQGVIPGDYLVGIEKQNVAPVKMIDSDAAVAAESEGEVQAERDDVLPAKYISAVDSGLKCTVTEDASQNVFKFNLED